MPEVLRGKYQYYTQANVSKLRATGYTRAMTPLPEAVRDYVQAYLVPGKKARRVIERGALGVTGGYHGNESPDLMRTKKPQRNVAASQLAEW
jgi:hypothetical protein